MASDDEEMEVTKEQMEMEDEDDDEGAEFDDETSSDSDEDEKVDEQQRETELINLRQTIESDPFNYENYVKYIGVARQYTNLEHLRAAREKMSSVFPLTEQLWLDWLRDEQQMATSKEQKQQLIDLFERAVKDYLSVMIWIEYVQFRISIDLSSNAIEELRNLFERALSSCALHVTEGRLLWASFIEVETAMLIGLFNTFHQNPSDDLKEKLCQSVEFILKLYRRQLTIPLQEMNLTYDEYNEFCQQYKEFLPSNYSEEFDLEVKRNFDEAMKKFEQCEKFEDQLKMTRPNVVIYQQYIESEKEPTRIQCLYERAIAENCLNGELWTSYIDFLDEQIRSVQLIQSVFERWLRNCPWISSLWIRYGEFLEFHHLADHQQLKSVYDRALNSDPTNLVAFVELQLAYLQYRRRHYENSTNNETIEEEIRRACESACDQYQDLFFSSANPKLFLKYNAQLELFWIHLEVKVFQSIDRARQIWNGPTLMNKSHNQLISNLWKQFYFMEIQYGDDKHARKILYRALNHVEKMDFPHVICDLLLEHEKKYGNIQQLKEAKDKLNQVKKKLSPPEKPQIKPKGKPTEKIEKPKRSSQTNGKKHDDPKEKQSTTARKRKLSPEETQTAKKKPTATTVTLDEQGFKIPPLPPPLANPKPATSSKLPPNHDVDHLNTVFIANLAYDINEEGIQNALSSAGPIKDIRIVKHEWSGKSKGFCYVDFATPEGYRQALKLDHTLVNGRPMFISPYDPNRSTSNDLTKKFKYSTNLEQNKLFISNLPFTATKEQVESLFQQQGFHPTNVRLVTYKSGKSKGLAYAEFKDAHDASQAILKVDKYEMDGHSINVAISNPPQRSETTKAIAAAKPLVATINKKISLGEAPKPTGPRGKGYSQISLVPRRVQVTNKTTTSESTPTPPPVKSNEEFRQMLLSKK